MKKLTLDLESLSLTSFDTEKVPASEGTVQGHLVPTNPWCIANSYRSYCPDSVCTCPPPWN